MRSAAVSGVAVPAPVVEDAEREPARAGELDQSAGVRPPVERTGLSTTTGLPVEGWTACGTGASLLSRHDTSKLAALLPTAPAADPTTCRLREVRPRPPARRGRASR
jgi:hypothetical protein